ncbi:hypothetical protein D3C76_1564200 [compost metagenome]
MDAVVGDLEQMLAIERGAGMGSDIDRVQQLAAFRVQGVDFAVAGEPDLFAVPGDAAHMIDLGKRAIFTNDFSSCVFHLAILNGGWWRSS